MESPGSTTSRNMIQTLEDNNSTTEIGIQRIQSFESKTGLESGETIHKTKLLSAGCSTNINELVRGASRTFDHVTGSFPGRTFSNELVSSVSVPAAAFPLDKSSDNATSQEDSDSSSWSKTQIEPSLPICLKFEDVKYKVPAKKMKSSGSEKYIIHGITGSVHPGEVLALMGTSGGGKTTLLNVLSGRVKFNSGTITYNDRPYTRSLKRRIGFVMQDDVAFPHLTVKETLTYAALLHLPSTLTSQQKKGRAMDVINELGLERCQNTMIGGAFVRGISGGERKRVCIGTEILLNPSLLFLDEPTSGLDSTTALRIVQMLQDIAKSGKTVVTTIHQPSSRLFSMFDKLILLGKGSSLYFGKASEAMLYFSSIGCSPLIAMNPAEFLIDLANGNINDKSVPLELEEMTCPGEDKGPCEVLVHEYLVEAYAATIASPEKKKALKPVVIKGEPEMQGGFNSMEWGATWWEQFSILSRRGLKERRHQYFSNMRVIQVLAIAIITGLLWWHSDASSHEDLKDQGGLLFFISVFWGFFPLFTSIFIFPQERAMLVKERSVGMYKLSAYFVARNISDLPLDLILPIVFVAIVYLMGGLKHSFPAFSLTMLTIFLSIVAAQGLGLAIGAACKDLKKATILASVIVMTFMLAGGFFIEEVPPFMSWARYISFTYHTYRLLLRIQYGCSGSDPKSGSCKSPFRGLKLDRPGIEISAIIAMIIGYRLLAYIILGRMKLRTGT